MTHMPAKLSEVTEHLQDTHAYMDLLNKEGDGLLYSYGIYCVQHFSESVKILHTHDVCREKYIQQRHSLLYPSLRKVRALR